jgi:hypothetical protein
MSSERRGFVGEARSLFACNPHMDLAMALRDAGEGNAGTACFNRGSP